MAISPLLCKSPGIHKNKKDRRCMLIDKAVPYESNTSAKFRKKLSKYQDLEIEVNQGSYRSWKTWNLRISFSRPGRSWNFYNCQSLKFMEN